MCLRCLDVGWLYPVRVDGRPDYSRTIRCECKAEEDRRRRDEMLMELCELPVDLKNKTFANFKVSPENRKTVIVARQMAEEQGDTVILTLLGEVNTGKSHLAVAVCNRWIERKRPARYAYVPSLLDELRQGIEDKSYGYRFNVMCTIPLLILDDLGLEKAGSWVTERLVTLINTRLINRLPTIVTTNNPLDQLPGDDHHRIASRLTREKFCYATVMSYTAH